MASEKQEYELSKPAYEVLRTFSNHGGTGWIHVETDETVLVFLDTETIAALEAAAAARGRTVSEWLIWQSQIRWN